MPIFTVSDILTMLIGAVKTCSHLTSLIFDSLWQNIASAIVGIITTDNKLAWMLMLIGLIAIIVRIAKNKPTWIIGSIIK